MCGIVGVVGKIYNKEETAFKLLLQFDTIRGPHSTGVVSVTKDKGKWASVKDVGTPWELFETADFSKLWSRTHLCLFGHNRWATRGAVNVDNAHPFYQAPYIGVHNGTLSSTWNFHKHSDYKVDSEMLYANMAHEGHEATLAKAQGAFALCWYNEDDGTVNLIRNKERPLFYCYTEDKKTVFWASEQWMLHVALMKADIKRGEIVFLAEGQLLSITVPVVAGGNIEELEVKKGGMEFYKAPEFRGSDSRDGYSDWWTRSRNREMFHEAEQKTKKGTTQGTQEAGKVVSISEGTLKANLSKRFLGKTVLFSVVGEKSKGNLNFILCEIEDQHSAPDLRVFIPGNIGLGKKLLGSQKMFQGKIKGITVYGGESYVVCDNRTIEEVEVPDILEQQSVQDHADSLKNKTMVGFKGATISQERYIDLTSKGCALCNALPSITGNDMIVWCSEDDFFCEDCSETQFAYEYMRNG